MGKRDFSNLLQVVLNFVRHRRPLDNAEHDIPDFLRPDLQRPAEPGQDGGGYPFDGAIKFIAQMATFGCSPMGVSSTFVSGRESGAGRQNDLGVCCGIRCRSGTPHGRRP